MLGHGVEERVKEERDVGCDVCIEGRVWEVWVRCKPKSE